MIRIEQFNGDRRTLISLYSLADDSTTEIERYMSEGIVIVAYNADKIIGHVQIVSTLVAAVFEIKSIAVRADQQGLGIGSALIDAAIQWCRDARAVSIVVSTAAADIDNLRFYQRRGFRMRHIVRDAFTAENGYAMKAEVDGIALRDAVVFELTIV